MTRFVFSLLACLQIAATALAAELPKLDFGSVREEHIMIPMRDGKRLSAYVYFPPGEGKVPGDLRAALRGHQRCRVAEERGEVGRGLQ
jgi:hypothetical protein